MPCDTPASVTTRTASTTLRPEPWLTRRPRNTTPLTSRPQVIQFQTVLTPQLLTAPGTPNSILLPKKSSIPHRECPSLLKPLPLLSSSCWTTCPGPTITLAPLPPP